MKLSVFMSALMPTFTKDSLDTEIEELQKNVNQLNIPYLEKAVKQVGRYEFQSTFAESLEEALTERVKVKKHVNFLGLFLEICKVMRDQLPVLERLVDDYFENDISVHNMNLQRVNLLQYIPTMNFICTYMRYFSSYAIGLEINHTSQSSAAVFDLKPADRDWLARHRQSFLDSVQVVYHRGRNLEKVFESIPDVSIDPSNAQLVETNLAAKGDPLGLNVIPLCVNPIFFIRKVVANYQITRYNAAKEEVAMLERKIYNLRMINEGRNDAKMQAQIAYDEDVRLTPLKQQIQEWEDKYVNYA